MNDIVKVAYGLGVLRELEEQSLDPDEFIKTAARSRDDGLHMAADAILCVAHFSREIPDTTAKVASTISEKRAFVYPALGAAGVEPDDPFGVDSYIPEAMAGTGLAGGLGGAALGALGGLGGGGNEKARAMRALLGAAGGGAAGLGTGAAMGSLADSLSDDGKKDDDGPTITDRLGLGG